MVDGIDPARGRAQAPDPAAAQPLPDPGAALAEAREVEVDADVAAEADVDVETADEEAAPQVSETLEDLREQGVPAFDPVRWRFIEAFEQRARRHRGVARRRLNTQLAAHLSALCERFESARHEAGLSLEEAAKRFPNGAAEMRRLHAAGDFKGLQGFIAACESGPLGQRPLADLVAHIARQSGDHVVAEERRPDAGTAPCLVAAPVAAATEPVSELRTLQRFRSTWSRLSADRKMTRAVAQLPGNAGPLNSHALALRAMRLMQEVSPKYLARFMSHLDALLWLERAGDAALSARKEPAAARGDGADRKRRSARAKTG